MAVATLSPEKIPDGFEAVKSRVKKDKQQLLAPLFQYYKKNWLVKRDPAEFSIYKMKEGTNNVCESYHANLAKKLSKRPNAWSLIGNITTYHK